MANGQQQTAIGKVNWKCEIQGQQVYITLFILKDTDLTVPIILGMDFLTAWIVLDFRKALYTLLSKGDTGEQLSFPFLTNDCCTTVHIYLVLPQPPITDKTLQTIRQLSQKLTLNNRLKGDWKI